MRNMKNIFFITSIVKPDKVANRKILKLLVRQKGSIPHIGR